MIRDAIGGFFSLELPAPVNSFHPNAMEFQSARAAFYALLKTIAPKRVFVPHFICDAMLEPLAVGGIERVFYDLDPALNIAGDIKHSPGDVLLYVNYFGICAANVDQVLARFGADRVIVDCSQAYYSSAWECLGTIYSPRKFFGVPDGGLLSSTLSIQVPATVDEGSLARSAHLLGRMAGSAESGYADYQRAEQTLCGDVEPRTMSQLTRRILRSIDHEGVRRARNANFGFLHSHLGAFNNLSVSLDDADAPLCYPLLLASTGLRRKLIEERVFVPQYWPDVVKRADPSSTSVMLTENLTCLPCDQRYDVKDMMRVVEICKRFFKQ